MENKGSIFNKIKVRVNYVSKLNNYNKQISCQNNTINPFIYKYLVDFNQTKVVEKSMFWLFPK